MAGWYGGNLGPNREETPAVWRDGLVKTTQQLPAGTKTFFLGNAPHPADTPSECVASNQANLTRCAMPAWFCTQVCPAVIADQLVYAGKHHIPIKYGEYLSGPIESLMAPALAE